MSTATDVTDIDPPVEAVCYRFDRTLTDGRWILLSTQLGPGLVGDYDAVSRPCCSDCVAALGLLEIGPE